MIIKYRGILPESDESVFIAESAAVIGKVTLKKDANIWFSAVLRGDESSIEVGEGSNVQDNATVHSTPEFPTVIGKNVTVGHNAIVHGAVIGDDTMIGMGACVMNGCVIGKNCIIAAGALVKENTVVPDGKVLAGIPAKEIKDTTPAQIRMLTDNAKMYVALGKEYK